MVCAKTALNVKNDSNCLDVKLTKMIKKIPTGTRSKLRKGEADFNQFVRLPKQLVVAAAKFRREEKASPVQIKQSGL